MGKAPPLATGASLNGQTLGGQTLGGQTRGAPVNKHDPHGTGALSGAVLESLPPGEGHDWLTTYPYQILSWHPKAVLFPNFMTPKECDAIIKIAEEGLQRSQLSLRHGETAEQTANIRTSDGVFVGRDTPDPTGTLKRVERRIADALRVPTSHFEDYNVLRYKHGQHYYSHMDTWDPKEFGVQETNRMVTVLLYLTDVEKGGETVLPREGEGNEGFSDYQSCEHGLKVKPRKGYALAFWSLTDAGEIDPHALHGGCPVEEGTKWVATKWVRNKPIRGALPDDDDSAQA